MNDKTMVDSLSKALHLHIKWIFKRQATATGQKALDDLLDSTDTSQVVIINIITTPYIFKSDNGKIKYLLQNQQSLLHCINIAKQDKANFLCLHSY